MRGGPGVHFHFGGPGGFQGAQFRQRARAQRGQGRQEEQAPGLGNLIQFIPFILIMLLSFMNSSDTGSGASYSGGENRYFSLTVCAEFFALESHLVETNS